MAGAGGGEGANLTDDLETVISGAEADVLIAEAVRLREERCPACGERNLREGRVAVSGANGIVALCTPECGYADAGPDTDGIQLDSASSVWLAVASGF